MSHLLLQGSNSLSEQAYFSSPPTRARPILQTYERSLYKGTACDSGWGGGGGCHPLGQYMQGGEKSSLSCAEEGPGAGACGVSSSPPECRCLRWRAVCLDCAHWLEEYVASTVCGGSVFPGLETDGREKNESRKPLLGTRYQTPSSWT